MIEIIKEAFNSSFKHRYETIFKQYYPAHNKTGFTERNLSCQYANALIAMLNDNNSFVWHDAPLPVERLGDCQYIPAVIFSQKNNAVFYILANRLGDKPTSKIQLLANDISKLLDNAPVNDSVGKRFVTKRNYILEEWGYNDINKQKPSFNEYIISISDYWGEESKNNRVEELLVKMKGALLPYAKDAFVNKLYSFDKDSVLANYAIFITAFKI
jgi:hypothetical protein